MASVSKYPALVMVLAYSGLRWGEAIGLRVKDLDMLKRRFLVTENAVEVGSRIVVGTPKNYKRRSVPPPRFLAEMLAQQCAGKHRDDLVFAGEDGGYLRSARVHEDNLSWFAWSREAFWHPEDHATRPKAFRSQLCRYCRRQRESGSKDAGGTAVPR